MIVLTHKPKALTPRATVDATITVADPAAGLILHFYREAESSAREAFNKARHAGRAAVICGRLLIEKRDSMKQTGKWQGITKPSAEKFLTWLDVQCPELSQRTAYRYMAVAERVAEKFELAPLFEVEGQDAILLSAVLTTPAPELPDAAQKVQQLVFDFCADKTITQLLNDAVLEPDSAEAETRFQRALNGKTKGGTHDKDNRKDFDKFIARKLSDTSSHFGHWGQFTALQKDKTFMAIDGAVEKWPTPVLEHLLKTIKEEMKKR